MTATWPASFPRIPQSEWVHESLEDLALNYDSVENHGWYSNLDHTVEQVGDYVRRGDIIVDYSGGTGIFGKRLLDRIGPKDVGVVIVDSSPKFLRLALEKFRDEPRMAFRLIRYLRDEKRLERVDEVVGPEIVERGVDGVVSTNAIHLYFNLSETLEAWRRLLRPSGRVFIQSGNIGNPDLPDDEWIIDETVEVIHETAIRIVQEDDSYEAYRAVLEDQEYMTAHDVLRRKYFLPVRPLDHYLAALRSSGFEISSVRHRRIPARVTEWFDFLKVYHEGVLGWVGGAEKITGTNATPAVVEDRVGLMRASMDRAFGDAFEFGASWTYITAEPKM